MSRSRPNIVLIMTDNQPADAMGCYGNDEIHTPNLDAIAGSGIRFDNAYCPNAMCSPSRASVWTGCMPCQHGVHTWIDDRLLDQRPLGWNAIEEFDSLPEILADNGYATAMIGKYHLGCLEQAQNGIQHWVTMARGHTLDFYGNEMRVNDDSFIYPGHSVDFFTEQAVAYIEKCSNSPEQPFLLLLPYNGPYGHWPSIMGPAKNQFWELYAEQPMYSVPREGINKKAIEIFQLSSAYMSRKKGGPDFSSLLQMPNDLTTLRNYYSQVSLIDDGVGRVMQALESGGLSEDTLVIYTADHGFSLGHYGFWGHGQATWPSNAFRIAYNIPLLIWGSGLNRGQVCSAHVSSMDLYATLIDFLDLPNHQDQSGIPSRSFRPLLSGEDSQWSNQVFIEQEETRAVRTPQWSYARRFNGSQTYPLENELYDLVKDPDERHNLVADGKFAEVEAELSKTIADYFGNFADPAFDLWNGGTVKSNTSRPWLWKDAWGDEWKPV